VQILQCIHKWYYDVAHNVLLLDGTTVAFEILKQITAPRKLLRVVFRWDGWRKVDCEAASSSHSAIPNQPLVPTKKRKMTPRTKMMPPGLNPTQDFWGNYGHYVHHVHGFCLQPAPRTCTMYTFLSSSNAEYSLMMLGWSSSM
jgi:hypothetical protein